MPVPDFQSLMLPLLTHASDQQEHTLALTREKLAPKLGLTPEDVAQLLPSGRQTVFANRMAWAKIYMQRAGLLSSIKRGHFQITPRGMALLAERPARIDIKMLDRYPEFVEFRTKKEDGDVTITEESTPSTQSTPEETFEASYQRIRSALAADLLVRLKKNSPEFFERVVVELLLHMGYGGSRREADKAIGRSGDEGIDGVISEDRLGLDMIYLQAKRWDDTVGRPEVQKFVGALHGKRAKKGVFITTGTFTADATEYVSRIDPKVVLINGRQLVELMIDFDLGVSTTTTYHVKRLDSDFFDEE